MGNWTGLGDTLVDCDCKCCLNYAMAAIEANNFNSLSSVAVVKTKQKNKRIETTILYTPFFCYKSMHNEYFPGQSECSSCNALRGMGSVHINYSWKWSFTWLHFFNLRCGCTWSSWGQERRKKNVCSSSGQLQLLEAPSGQQIMTKLPQRLCNQHVEASRRRLLSALDLIRGRGDALAPH